MKHLIVTLFAAAAFAAAQPYTSTVETQVITAADCVGHPGCMPGIQVTASTTDPQAVGFGIRISYFAGGQITELKLAAIEPTTHTATVQFYFPDPTLITVQKVLAWPLVNPPSDPPAIINNDPRAR